MLKNNKGISLATMVVTVMVMLIIMSTLTYSAVNNVKVRKLNRLYNDIRALNDEVAVYYLKYGKLPIEKNEYASITTDETKSDVMNKPISFVLTDDALTKEKPLENENSLKNPNDYDESGAVSKAVYYKINLDLFDNLSLNYNEGTYIINPQSHTIYYAEGITVDGKTYNMLPLNYKDTQYNVRHPLTALSAKNVYLPMGGIELDLKDYLVCQSNIVGVSGVPKNVKYTPQSVEANNYFSIDNGIIKSKDIHNKFDTYNIDVSATSYGSDQTPKTTIMKVLLTDLVLTKDKADQTKTVEKINLVKGDTVGVDLYTVKKGSSGNVTATCSVADISTIAKATIDSTTDNFKITGKNVGTTKISFTEANGKATKSVLANVYDFKIKKENTQNEITKIDFTSLNDTMFLDFKSEGPDLDFTLPENSVSWASSDTSIITCEANNLKAKIIPKAFGEAKVICTITVDNEILKTIEIIVKVAGVDIIEDSSLKIKSGDTNIPLKFNTSLQASEIKTCEWTSKDDTIASVKLDSKDNSGMLTANTVGTTTITLNVTKNDGTIYTDTYKVIVQSK